MHFIDLETHNCGVIETYGKVPVSEYSAALFQDFVPTFTLYKKFLSFNQTQSVRKGVLLGVLFSMRGP